MKLSCSQFALITALSTLSASAFAQTGPATTTDEDVVVVVAASRTQLDAREIGSAITVTTEEDIEKDQILFVKEVLQNIPGVQISSVRPGGFTSVSIRGSDNDQVLFLLDGIELGDPSAISTQFSSEHITSLDIARIEVLRGNQSSLYGSDAIGGVVNIITKRATEEGLHINAEAEGGSENTRSGGVTLLGKSGAVDYRLTGAAFAAGGPSLSDPETGTATEDDAYERWSLSGRVGVAMGETIDAQLIGFYSSADSDLDNATSDNFDTSERDEYGAAVQVKHETTDARWRQELTVSRYNAERTLFGGFNRPEGDSYYGVKDAALYVLNFKPSSQFSLAGGLNWEEESTEQYTNFSGAFDAGITTEAAFVELAFRPIEALSFTVAGRLDDNSRFGQFDTYRVTGAYVAPALVAGGDVKLRASYGTGAKAPGLYQLFDPSFGNAGLEVETSEGFDAGVDIYWDRAQLEFTLFSTDVTNEISFGSRPTAPLSFGYIQFGKTEVKGGEFGARVELAPFLFLTQTVTVIDSQDGETGLWRKRPRFSGATGLTFQLAPRWDLSARMRYRSENKSSFGGAVDSFKTLDILTSYDVSDAIEFYGRIANVSDERYQMTFGSNAPDQGVFAGVRLRM